MKEGFAALLSEVSTSELRRAVILLSYTALNLNSHTHVSKLAVRSNWGPQIHLLRPYHVIYRLIVDGVSTVSGVGVRN